MYTKEIGVFICTSFVVISVVAFKPLGMGDRLSLISKIDFSSAKILPMLSANIQTIDNEVLVAQRVDLEKMINESMNYSYPNIKVGFTDKTIDSFFKLSKAEVEAKILASVPKRLQENAKKYLRAVLILSEKYQVDPIWVFSIMWTESHFKFSAESSVGAQGLMQIMPTTHSFIYQKVKLNGKTLEADLPGFNMSDFFPYKVPAIEYQVHMRGITFMPQLLIIWVLVGRENA